MGVISITQRKETLGNIGSTPMAHGVTDTDAGSARSGAYARTFSPHYYAKREWQGGDGVSSGLFALGRVAAGISVREDERESDELTRKVIDQLDRIDRDDRQFTPDEIHKDSEFRYLLGDADADGNYANAQRRGLRLRTGAGTRRLVQETDETFADVFTKVAEELGSSDKAKTMARERLFNYQQGRVKYAFDAQAKEYRRMEKQGASDQLSAFTSAYLSGNSDVLGDVFEARDKLGILEGKTEEQRRVDRQTLAQDIAESVFSQREAETSGNPDPEAVEATWKEWRAALVSEEGERPDDPLLGVAMDNGVDKAAAKRVLAAFDRCRNRAVSASQVLKSQNQRKVQDDLVMREQALFKEPPPEDEDGIVGGMTSKAMSYAKFADEAEAAGLGRVALSYRHTADALREGAKDYRKTAARERQAENAALQKTVYETTAADFDLGGYYRDDGRGGIEWVEENAWERQERAAALYKGGKVNYVQFTALMAKTRPEVDDAFKAVRNHVLDSIKRLVPNAIKYNSRSQVFEVSPTAKVRGSTKTQQKWETTDGRQAATYAELVQAMNLAMQWGRNGKKSVAEICDYFDKMASGSRRAHLQATVQENLDFEKKTIEEYRRR